MDQKAIASDTFFDALQKNSATSLMAKRGLRQDFKVHVSTEKTLTGALVLKENGVGHVRIGSARHPFVDYAIPTDKILAVVDIAKVSETPPDLVKNTADIIVSKLPTVEFRREVVGRALHLLTEATVLKIAVRTPTRLHVRFETDAGVLISQWNVALLGPGARENWGPSADMADRIVSKVVKTLFGAQPKVNTSRRATEATPASVAPSPQPVTPGQLETIMATAIKPFSKPEPVEDTRIFTFFSVKKPRQKGIQEPYFVHYADAAKYARKSRGKVDQHDFALYTSYDAFTKVGARARALAKLSPEDREALGL